MSILETTFWCLCFLIIYTYLGYGLVLFILVRLKRFLTSKPKEIAFTDDSTPRISFVIPCFNELDILQEKIDNTLLINYPTDKLDIVFVTDGSDDGSVDFLKKQDQIQYYHSDKRNGKMHAMNRIMDKLTGDIVVFSDANAMLNEDALRILAIEFMDEKVGCVSGEKRVSTDTANGAASNEGIYWKYESTLKRWSYELNSVIGAAGELFAIRRNLYEAPEKDTILDDFMISMNVIDKGYKIGYTSEAYAVEKGSANMNEEMKRKVRICAGGIQSIIRTVHLLNPLKYPLFAFQYISHRILRWTITPLALIVVFPINWYLSMQLGGIYSILFVLQLLFHSLAVAGMIANNNNLKLKILFIPFYFNMMNTSALLGFKNYLLGQQAVTWDKAKRA